MSPEDWLQAEMQGEIVALVHSHPGGLPWLSEADRRLQVQSDLPCWLVCRGEIHKFRCVPHLTGRRFEHGVTDCYTLFRDAYHLAGIEMPDFHRGDDWWRHGQNLYLDNLEATGLYQVPLSAAQPGDVLLCCFGSSVPNHAAIYCGDGELLHHIPEQLSKRERYDAGQHHRPAAEQNALVVIHRNHRCETVLPEHGIGRRTGGFGAVRQPAGEP